MRTVLPALALLALALAAGGEPAPLEPEIHLYATHGGVELAAHVFTPAGPRVPRPAIVVLHGGGWHIGEPSWGYGPARRFAALGLVAISGQYRLSGEAHPGVTPIEAMADARALFRWVRTNAERLGIDPGRVAAYGWSAGAHLVASAAIWTDADPDRDPSCAPDAMILSSPALSLHHDRWLRRILGDRAEPADISPDRHVRPGLPPALILQGRTDTVTPLAGTRLFHEAMLAAGNESELVVYDGVGHLFTPSSQPDTGWPDPDPEVSAAANRQMKEFLRARGFVD